MPLDSKHPEASFSPTSTDSLYFQVAEVPKSQDLVIFLWTTTTTTTRPITLSLAHARGVISLPVYMYIAIWKENNGVCVCECLRGRRGGREVGLGGRYVRTFEIIALDSMIMKVLHS